MSNIWMMVTMDEYELPVLVADSSGELARMAGTESVTIRSAVVNAKRFGIRSKWVKVEVDDDETD